MRKILFLLAMLACESASAGGRVVVGVGFGFPLWYPPAPYYYPYYPAPVVVSRPVTYIERREVTRDSTDWWYYCQQSSSYYPYAKTCPGGWQKVSPSPVAGRYGEPHDVPRRGTPVPPPPPNQPPPARG